MKCRTRPETVEAFQFVEGPQQTPDWLSEATCLPHGFVGKASVGHGSIMIYSDLGWRIAHHGDWIVRHGMNDLRVVKADEFDNLYEETR